MAGILVWPSLGEQEIAYHRFQVFSQQIVSTYYMLGTVLDSRGSRLRGKKTCLPSWSLLLVREAHNEQISQGVISQEKQSRAKKLSGDGKEPRWDDILRKEVWTNERKNRATIRTNRLQARNTANAKVLRQEQVRSIKPEISPIFELRLEL